MSNSLKAAGEKVPRCYREVKLKASSSLGGAQDASLSDAAGAGCRYRVLAPALPPPARTPRPLTLL